MRDMHKPRRIRIDASTICQLNCPSCPGSSGATRSGLGLGFLSLRNFEQVLDDNPFVREVELSNYGEIFLNPELVGIMRAAHERRVRLTADTGVNLNTANEEQLEGLVRYRVCSVSCSIDGASADTYKRYRVHGDFDRVIRNIESINAYKRRYQSPYPLLTWQFIVFGHNEHEISLARRRAGELNMRFRLKLSWDETFSPVRNPGLVRREIGYASRSEYRLQHGIDQVYGICRDLWERPQINWDGRVLGCSRNFWRTFSGNAFSDGLVPTLNTEDMAAARAMLSGEPGVRADVACSTCDIYRDRVATGRFVNRSRHEVLLRNVSRLLRRYRPGWRLIGK